MSKVIGASSKVAPAQQGQKLDPSFLTSSGGLQEVERASWRRLMCALSYGPNAEERIIVDNSTSGLLQLAKMFAVVAIPVITVIIICSLQLSSAIQGYNAADAATGAFQEYLNLDKLVTGVQLERGLSAAWVSSRGTNIDAKITLTPVWVHNDDSLQSLTRWPPSGLHVADKIFRTAKDLSFHINSLRDAVISSEMTFTQEIKEYTAITNALMSWSLSVIMLSSMSTIWSMIVSNAALLLASDVIGIQRALQLSLKSSSTYVVSDLQPYVRLPLKTSNCTEVSTKARL